MQGHRASPPRRTVAVVGAGAAGALVALQLCGTAVRRRSALDLVLIDPAPEAGRGIAYATTDPRHLLNVPAGHMSCHPDDPGHFLRWLRGHGASEASAADFVARHRYGSYLADTLGRAIVEAHGTVTVRRLRTRATGLRWRGPTARLELADGGTVDADGVVLATGPNPSSVTGWAAPALRASDRLIVDPWAPGALDPLLAEGRTDDVLLVGTGLTAVDVALRLGRPGRTVHALSRGGRLPQPHALTPLPAVACPEDLHGLPLTGLRAGIRRHISQVLRTHGDWRPAFDGLRPLTARLWGALSVEERAAFLEQDSSLWNVHRHRMPPATAEAVARMCRMRRLWPYAGRITAVRTGPDTRVGPDARVGRVGRFGPVTVTVALAGDGGTRELSVGWVVNCTGPDPLLRDAADPLWRGLLDTGGAVPGPLGMGVATDEGRLRDAGGRAVRPLWTLGAPRRGELWETTAVPEIRVQAEAVATAVLDHLATLAPAPHVIRKRPCDGSGLALSTHDEAAAAYRLGLDRLLTVRAGAASAFRRAAALDPGFALAHAALALLDHECGADALGALAGARRAARDRADARERSWVEAVACRIEGTGADKALLRHLDDWPGDLLALAATVPGLAFSGVHDRGGSAVLRVLEQTRAAHQEHWFPTSLLAFLRQEEGRYEEAAMLAEQALAAEPASGNAVHALAHADYARGLHRAGRERVDQWLGSRPEYGGAHRGHFAWHAALHDLALGDEAAVRRRWATRLAPTQVRGAGALIDTCSLAWRIRLAGGRQSAPSVDDVLEAVPPDLLERPPTAFLALHAALALAAADSVPGLRRLHAHARGSGGVRRQVVAPLCDALEYAVEERWGEAADELERILPAVRTVGGSDVQREVVEETLLYALIAAGRHEAARARLEARPDRRPSPYDRTRPASPPPAPPGR
ncbi:FAD/NAD(P)-binding protein [Streptomyces laurentii]|uniref:FAD/NAD(P)-binding protein n=1 Tax=Streptomyces laurentii TaxID=39478 RepID=UPI0036C45019